MWKGHGMQTCMIVEYQTVVFFDEHTVGIVLTVIFSKEEIFVQTVYSTPETLRGDIFLSGK
jgi:hypothetical protein